MTTQLQSPIAIHLLRRIDSACDRFEDEWRRGRRPQVEDYIEEFDTADRFHAVSALQSLQHELLLCPATFVEAPRVALKVTEGPHAGQEFSYQDHNTLFAGRLSSAELRLEKDGHFSRYHFRLEINPPTCYLMDLSSRNGTFVNGERVTSCFLKNGDIISGGRTKMTVFIDDPAGTAAVTAVPVPATRPKVETPAPAPVVTPLSPSASVYSLQPRIPGYQLHTQIGEGDLGIVYRATRMATSETCALKVIKPSARADDAAIRTFLREASILLKLKHPRIVRFIDLGAEGQDVFLATEYIESMSWDAVVVRSSPEQRIRLACGLMCQVLSALEYAHSQSMVHRDVKPSNVLFTRSEGKLSAKLADFGLAKQYTTAGMSQVTRDGDVIGSLPFMSPDQFLNSREARPTCDIYSAGATLYWMLTGAEPIPLDSHACKFLAILESPPTAIQKHNPAIPHDLARIVHQALEKTPEKRFGSAAEFGRKLKSFSR
ncbi:MAG: protein kinase [Planctomycetes bacterium]|nr:protein kinase [Planctomycetota bacterium]